MILNTLWWWHKANRSKLFIYTHTWNLHLINTIQTMRLLKQLSWRPCCIGLWARPRWSKKYERRIRHVTIFPAVTSHLLWGLVARSRFWFHSPFFASKAKSPCRPCFFNLQTPLFYFFIQFKRRPIEITVSVHAGLFSLTTPLKKETVFKFRFTNKIRAVSASFTVLY